MDMPSLSGGHVHFLCHRVGWWPVPGTCSFFPRDMLIFRGKEWAYGRSGRHAQSFRGTCSFFAAKNGHMGDMSRLRCVGRACPVRPGTAWASRGTCSVFRCVPGQPKRTCSRLQELETGPGGHAYSFRDMPSFPRDMSILSAGHAHFSRQGVGIWRICPGFGVWGGHVPCNPGLPGPAAGHARSFWSAAGQPGDMLIRSQAPRSHQGGHVHSSRQGPDIWGICPGLGVSGGHVQRAGGDPPSQIKPARGHCVLPTAEDGTQ